MLMDKRLDVIISEKFGVTRTKAQALIMAGQVYASGHQVSKAGMKYDEDAQICVKELFPYVSRGALKLEKAHQEFEIDFTDKVICDIGSSTGGFTDYALQHGAKKVFAIDVGTGQLAQKIREDDRVVVMEKTDFRNVGELPDNIDIFVCDVSFISLKKIIPKVAEIIRKSRPETIRSAQIILLIKPQFEAGVKDVSKGKGVIKDESLRQEIVGEIQSFAQQSGFSIAGLTESPITGAKGNVEYLLYLKYSK
jgi:23S rRNA (cytidine1920-2'-O)/16S rRNA (cytidine1409-2'-O)-methyltransferase